MRVADNTNDQACSRRILSDFGRHNKYLQYFFQSHVFPHDVSCLTFSPVCLLHRLSQGFARSTEQARSARAGDKREVRERDDGNERIARGGVMEAKLVKRERLKKIVSRFCSPPLPPSFLSPPLSSIINSNVPQKSDRERLGTRQPKCYPAKNFTVHLDNVQVFWVRKRAYCF